MSRPRVRIFCDYSATGIWDYPLYPSDDDDQDWYPYFRTDVDTAHEPDRFILRDLALWNERWEAVFQAWVDTALYNEGTFDCSLFDPDAFTAEGFRLAYELKCNHPDWEVVYIDEVAYERNIASKQKERRSFTYEISLGDNGEMVLREL
ncbi:MAG: hypothetical protein Q8O35_02940 [Humidesulfovibrio sp.]|jgi:hypothetical protein|uniref:hypothetical protein n=1 Tax=Humidesulfovibrio sp. TaxID=2910988 RepID=UPI002734F0AE|nr:hypothetical protein [Humidesulfovibrio sp.]MDP2847132.1 hypothetical protein [Humidesulfovibrio sp.]